MMNFDTIHYKQFRFLAIAAIASLVFLLCLHMLIVPEAYSEIRKAQIFTGPGRYVLTLPLSIGAFVLMALCLIRATASNIAVQISKRGLEIASLYQRKKICWDSFLELDVQTIRYRGDRAHSLCFWYRAENGARHKLVVAVNSTTLPDTDIADYCDYIEQRQANAQISSQGQSVRLAAKSIEPPNLSSFGRKQN